MSEISGGSAENDEMNTPRNRRRDRPDRSGHESCGGTWRASSWTRAAKYRPPPQQPKSPPALATEVQELSPQQQAEVIHQNTIASILQENGAYFSPKDAARVSQGADSIRVVQDLARG